MRHIVDFRNTSDTGEIDAAAIIPYNDGEAANQTTFRRPVENIRTRTEVLRKLVRSHVLMRDVDRNGPALFGGGTITFNGTVAGGGDGKFTTTASLFVVPMVTPGDGVGTTAPYVASSKASLAVGTLGSNQVIIESVQKQFEGSDLAKSDVNRLSVEILNDTADTIALEGAAGDVNNIKITIRSGTTTAQELIDLINTDVTVTQYVTASLEATSTGTNVAALWGPTEWAGDYSLRFLKGGHPGIVHEIPFGNISSFFSASAENCLQKGDTLAISYDDIIDEGGTGGVLQSTPENGNTIMGPGSLFNTRREPEKCANAIPICKCIDDDNIVFIDGSYITKGAAATLYFDSGSVKNSALLGAITTPGWTRMHIAPGAHTPPTNVQEALNNADDLFENVMAEITNARNSTVYGAQASLDARMEASDTEINNARSSSVYGAKASLDLRLEDGDTEISNARSSTVFGAKGSLDARIEAVDTHAATVVTVGPTGSGRMYTGATGLYDAMVALNGTSCVILVDGSSANYTMGGNLTISDAPMHIIGKPSPFSIIGVASVILDLGTYTLTMGSGGSAWAAGSGIENVRLYTSTTGQQLKFRDSYCFLKRCYIQCQVLVDDNASSFLMEDCYQHVAGQAALIGSASAYGLRIIRTEIRQDSDLDLTVVDVNTRAFIQDCLFRIAGGNTIEMYQATLRDSRILAQMDLAGTNPALYTADSVVENVQLTVSASNPVVQKGAYLYKTHAKGFYVNGNNQEIRYQYCFIHVQSADTESASLSDFEFKNFNLPYDTNALLTSHPLIGIAAASKAAPVTLKHGSVRDVGHAGSPTGNMYVSYVGRKGDGPTGPVTIEDVTINTTGVTYGTGSKFGIWVTGTDESVIRNCTVHGTGMLSQGIVMSDCAMGRVCDNVIESWMAWANAINITQCPQIKCTKNRAWINGSMSSDVIYIAGNAVTSIVNGDCSHNQVVYTGSSWSFAAGIHLNYVDRCLVFGNIVSPNITTKIDYSNETNMVPIAANLGTYNVIA